ncbi:MAG: hypothetical protein FJX02_12925 [Alphaproteobacteria bacterium]|nr:hypothetical protein [Alphaproteobacteria bacterium]
MPSQFAHSSIHRYWQDKALTWGLWLVFAAVFITMTSTRHGFFFNLLVAAVIVLPAACILFVLRTFIGWLVWRLIWRDAEVAGLTASFRTSGLPAPPAHEVDPVAWFGDLVYGPGSAALTVEQRMAAGYHLLRVGELAEESGVARRSRIEATYKMAIAAFRQTAVAPTPPRVAAMGAD